MAMAWANEPEWFDLSDDLERIATEAGLVYTDDGWSWPRSTPNVSGFGSYEVTPCPAGYYQSMGGLHGLMPLSGPIQFPSNVLEGPSDVEPPQMQGFPAAPPAPVSASRDAGTCFRGNDDNGYEGENFPGGGLKNHQSTLEWTVTSAQEAEISTGLALTKPNTTHNDHQMESSNSTPSGLRGRYIRVERAEKKKRCLAQIREALGVSSKDELSTLERAVQHLGGTVPQRLPPSGELSKSEKQAMKLAERHRLFNALKDLVCPWMGRTRELPILEKALEEICGAGEPRDPEGTQPSLHVIRLDDMVGGGHEGSVEREFGGSSEAGPSSYSGVNGSHWPGGS